MVVRIADFSATPQVGGYSFKHYFSFPPYTGNILASP